LIRFSKSHQQRQNGQWQRHPPEICQLAVVRGTIAYFVHHYRSGHTYDGHYEGKSFHKYDFKMEGMVNDYAFKPTMWEGMVFHPIG
jgi:hypothetical protein